MTPKATESNCDATSATKNPQFAPGRDVWTIIGVWFANMKDKSAIEILETTHFGRVICQHVQTCSCHSHFLTRSWRPTISDTDG